VLFFFIYATINIVTWKVVILLRIGLVSPSRPSYNNPKKNYSENEDDEDDETEEYGLKLSPEDIVYSFFCEYALNAEGYIDDTVAHFFLLTGFKKFSQNTKLGKKDMNKYFGNQY